MEFRDDSDGEAESESELAPCPYCEGKDCTHQVLWHSRCNCDWIGLLADKTSALEAKLETAAAATLELDAEAWFSDASQALSELLENKPPESAAFRTYWLALADEASGSEVVRVDWDGGGPGMSDSFFHVFFKDPAKGIKDVLAQANADLAFMKSLAPPKAKKKRVAKRKARA